MLQKPLRYIGIATSDSPKQWCETSLASAIWICIQVQKQLNSLSTLFFGCATQSSATIRATVIDQRGKIGRRPM
jgi:hypothetical protein